MSLTQLTELGYRFEAELVEKRIDSLFYVTCDIDHPRQRVFDALWQAQAEEARAVIRDLIDLGVEPLVFKGVEVAARYDEPGPVVGERHDIDLLVPMPDLWKAQKVLYGRDYIQGGYLHEHHRWAAIGHLKRLRHEVKAYELWPFRRGVPIDLNEEALTIARENERFVVDGSDCQALVKVDVHHNVLYNFDVSPFYERSIAGGLGVGLAPCPADHLRFSLFRYYGEVAIGWKVTLRALVAVAPMVCDPEMDWDLLVKISIEERAAAPSYFWLRFFREIGAMTVPQEALDALHAQLASSERHWGWQLERLFEVDFAYPKVLS